MSSSAGTKSSAREIVANALTRAQNIARMFGGSMAEATGHKRDHWIDYGYPETLSFHHFYRMYTRNGIASAGVSRVVDKCWQDAPWLLQGEGPHDETETERAVRDAFDRLQLWQHVRELDERSRVGRYAALLLRFADGKRLSEPVDRVPGGLMGLVEVIPLYEPQLEVVEWDTDERSASYGWPTMYSFHEAAVEAHKERTRSTQVHPDRVLIWSRDGTVWDRSALEPGYNALVTLEKVAGAAGEGFWKAAKNSPILSMDTNASPDKLARLLGTTVDGLAEKIDEQVDDYQRGFDSTMLLQGITAGSVTPTLPQNPEHYVLPALQEFAASIPIPMKELLGSQSGERASTEDASQWGQTAMARRENLIKPNLRRLVRKLEALRVLPSADWSIDWSDLTEPTAGEKVDRANKMAEVNQKMLGTGERVFTGDEIREAVGYEPLGANDAEPWDDDAEPPAMAANTGRVRWRL